VFSGYVLHQQLVTTMSGKAPLAALLTGRVLEGTRTLRMRGPGGCGLAEVAVTAFYGERAAGGGGLLSRLTRSVLEPGGVAFRCALLRLQVPVDALCAAVLRVDESSAE